MYMNRSMDDNTAPPCRADRKKISPGVLPGDIALYITDVTISRYRGLSL